MVTRLRSIAVSTVIKLLLWVLFIGFTFYTLVGGVSVYRTAEENNLQIQSLTTMEYVGSQEFGRLPKDLVSALYGGVDLSKVEALKDAPLYDYRVEYADGSVVSTVQTEDMEAFVKGHGYFGIYQTLPTGEWRELAYGGNSRWHYTLQSIERDMKWLDNGNILYPENNFDEPVITEQTEPLTDYSVTYLPDGSQGITPKPDTTEEYSTYSIDVPENRNGWTAENPCPQVTVYYAFNDAALAEREVFWQQCRRYYMGQMGLLAVLGAAAALCALWLLVVCGRRSADREAHLLGIDRLWTEVILALWSSSVLAFIGLTILYFDSLLFNELYRDPWMVNLLCGGLAAVAAVFLFFTMSLVRQLKAHVFLRNALTFKCLRWCWHLCKKIWDMLRSCFDQRAFANTPLTKALQTRQTVYLAVLGLALFMMLLAALADDAGVAVLLMLPMIAGIGVVTFWQIQGNRKTYLEINKGFNESFEEQMKSERTKTALITNVSHDLKTPLTSIITYLDLLGQEELPEAARDYVAILAQKSERLKAIVSDLFDLTKSSSGNLPLDLEVLDLKRLLEQTLADMKDSIDGSGLVFKVKLPEREVNIYSDGKKLYRVFQNLIDNALKYSMEGSRVFVTLDAEGETAVASIKNISSYEIDFTAEEILQRFNRGDKSRSGDGSGLGLSIAESFTGACGGSFKVEIDGDLFKVTTSFKADNTVREIVQV